ncbi:hypothetical protein [Ammoniphilus sp. CFH 90114]|uniref:hypothetical protein n=1 Tax=Ammoniphilus sp. CFH 90114 TaxID=2493665 RepID=UPI00100F8E2F|nr:hypothetical protein [Ammoniphilus sp. CFH 90114]RXT04825.1 hypothetical protein EIZ39_19045 [Ammoniphilus sp. CFH 90114]
MTIRGMIQKLIHFLPISPDKHALKLDERLRKLENDIMVLKDVEKSRSIIVENLNIEKIIVDRVHYENNIGTIGIKELEGKLNIGANYETDSHIAKVGEKKKGLVQKQNQKASASNGNTAGAKKSDSSGPAINLKNRTLSD